MHSYTEGGLQHIWLRNGYRIKSSRTAKIVVINNPQHLKKTICTALSLKAQMLSGPEFRFLRKEMNLPATTLCKRLDITDAELAAWESAPRLPRIADTFIRIFYAAHAGRPERLRRLAATPSAGQIVYFMLEHANGRWTLQETLQNPDEANAVDRNIQPAGLTSSIDSLE